jgi:hypothetical protein
MILKSIAEGIKAQDWFVVIVEVMIVVVGIFMGLQVDDWNKERTFKKSETELLHELSRELEASIHLTEARLGAYKQVAEAGSRSLHFISSGASCDAECWPILLDFMHASQWQGTSVRTSTYETMRTLGMPSNRAIIDAVEAYLLITSTNVEYYDRLPFYRSLVRRLIPLEIQTYYWEHCYSGTNGLEYYDLDCPKPGPVDLSSQIVEDILGNVEIKPHLTEWTGSITGTPDAWLGEQNSAAQLAISLIDEELSHRQ